MHAFSGGREGSYGGKKSGGVSESPYKNGAELPGSTLLVGQTGKGQAHRRKGCIPSAQIDFRRSGRRRTGGILPQNQCAGRDLHLSSLAKNPKAHSGSYSLAERFGQ